MDPQEPVVKTDDELWAEADKARLTQAEDAPVEAPPADDPMAGLPEPTRKLIEGLQTRTAEFDTRFQSVNQQLARANGTIGNLKQRLDESQGRLQAITPTIEAVEAEKKAAEQAQQADAAKKRTEIRERLADFPDVLEYLDMVVPADAKPAEVKAEPKAEIKPDPDQPDFAERERVLILQRELSDRVPGWMRTRDTPEFKAWLPAQADDIKAKAGSWDVDEAASVFAAFEKHKSDAATVAQVEQDRDARLRRGEGVQGRGSSNAQPDSGGDEWERAKRDREKARAAG